VPKMYDASHGMCQACGAHWLAAAEGSYGGSVITRSEIGDITSSVLKIVRSISRYISGYFCDRRWLLSLRGNVSAVFTWRPDRLLMCVIS